MCCLNALHITASGCRFENAVFSKFGEVSLVARSMKLPGKISAFMDQYRKKGCCLCLRV